MHLAGGNTSRNLPLDGFDIYDAIQQGGRASPRTEIPVNIAACPKQSTIVDGPQAALILGDMKVIAECWWRGTKTKDKVQLYNITADRAEENDMSSSHPELLQKVCTSSIFLFIQPNMQLLARLDYWEAQSLPPYPVDKSCGEGKPQGTPPHWDSWC